MSLPIVIASNQTAGAILLTRLGLTVPASSTLTLTDFAFVNEIKEDESLHQAIVDDEILLDLGQGELTKGDSLKFFAVVTLEVRRSVRVLAAANVASLAGTTTIDTVALAVDDRVLLTAQATASENGIWVVKAGAWQRPSDFAVGDSAAGAIILVQEGATYAGETWNITSISGSDIIGTNNLAVAQLSGGGGSLQDAYDNGATITTASSTNIAFTLTSGNFTVNGGGLVDLGGTTPLSSFNLDATGAITLDSSGGAISLDGVGASNFTTDSGNLTLNTTTSGEVLVDGAGGVEINSSGGAIDIGNDADAQAINVGTGAAARTITVGNATGATQLDFNSGTGGTLIDSTGVISLDGVGASNFTTDSGDLTLSTTTSGDVEVNSVAAVNVTSGTTTDIQATGNVTVDSSGGTIGVGTDADDGAINIGTGTTNGRTITIGSTGAANTTSVNIDAGDDGAVTIDAPTTTITGNLVVQGTTSTVESEIVNVADNFLYLNDGYTTASALEGGFVVNSLPTATSDTVNGTFTAGVAAVSNPTVVTTGSATFAAGDFIQVSGAADQQNDGLYEVLSHVGTTLTIRGVGTAGTTYQFFQNDFVTDATAQGAITKVTVGAVQVDATGNLQYGYGADTGAFAFADITTGAATLSLQSAYDGGNTIATSGGNSVVISGSESLQVTATGGINLDTVFDADVTVFDVQMTGTNGFSIDGTAASNVSVNAGNLTLATTTSGSILVDGVDGVEINSSAGNLQIGNDANTGDINVGTGAAARDITIGNTTGATGVTVNSGTEKVEIDGVTYYGSSAGLPTATTSGFQDGDKYYDTNLDMEMRYDATRGKWLSVEVMTLMFGRNGNTGAGTYYRGGADGRVMSSTIGYIMPFAATVVGLGYTRTDSDAATFDVVEGGTSRATLASAATSGQSRALNGDFAQNGILAILNQAGGNTTSNVVGWVQVKFRGT
jgi:hypothetical protein